MADLSALSDVEIVGLTLIGEARGETIAGQVAVGSVIRNRANSRKQTYQQICLAPEQFSCWNHTDTNYSLLMELSDQLIAGQKIVDPYLRQCMFVAKGIVEGDIFDNTNGAMNYLAAELFFDHKLPSWAKNVKNLRTIGNQIFFNV